MCVIIGVPKGAELTEAEIRKAWSTNPHGAGYAIQTRNRIHQRVVRFQRGFMELEDYLKAVLPLIGKYNLLLHFRISTSNAVNQIQTHPYKIGDKTALQGETKSGVVCMNGSIFQQTEYKGFNDTMSYISDYLQVFQMLADNPNQELLNLIESDTGSRWALMTPTAFKFSSDFKKQDGKYYSNTNHLTPKTKTKVYRYSCIPETEEDPADYLVVGLQKQVRNRPKLHQQLKEYIKDNPEKLYCLWWIDTLQEIKDLINGQYYRY